MIDNIGKEVDVHIMQKNKEQKNQEIKTVVKYITACLNTDGGVVILKNNDWKDATGKYLDDWYGIVEQKLFDECSKFIKFEGTYQDKILRLRITPLPYLFSVDMHLHFSRNTDIVEVKYTQAIEILKTNDKSGSLSELPAIVEYFEYKKKMSKLSENDGIQFKEIRSDNVPSKFSSTINRYISAFCNHKGGRILFGIEDKEFKVVGVELTNKDKESITKLIHNKMDNTMKWGRDCRIYKNGIHWSIDFLPIQNITKDIPDGKTLEVIVVSVCRYPGGVFTDTPKAYYIREDGAIQQFTFEEWKTRIKLYLSKAIDKNNVDAPFTKEGGIEILRSLAYMSNEISIIKDKVISGNLASQTAIKIKFMSYLVNIIVNQTETTPQEESQNCTAKKRQVALPETEFINSKPKILVSPIARPTDPENTCLQTKSRKEAKSTVDDLQELQVRYWTSKLEKQEKEKRKLDLENESLERLASHEQNQSMPFEQIREAIGLIADQTEETSQEESLNGSKLNCTATKRQVLLPETETTSNKPKILVPPLARPTDPENTCLQNEPIKEAKSTEEVMQELQVKVLTSKLEKLEKEKKKLDLEIGCLERRGSQKQNNLVTFEQLFEALGLTIDNTALKRQVTLPQPKTTSSRKIANVTPLERQTDSEKVFLQTETTSVLQEQVLEM
ncbi:unnamed protein product [Mytilus coruscus]|uniref:Schlafen AlbA-2 domain-containing protein n=1 Tax=Mytilus coruscus TaxID=42192 RepID=A0A6J8EEG1_MYTCO|nr:unnamed protein product [Mytilus coruscus]